MPRPKLNNDVLKREVRITPPDQTEITNWKQGDDFSVLLIAREGEPNGSPRLHYHLYIETQRSESWLRNWIKCVLVGHFNPEDKINGNAMYFVRKPHERTIPYVVKHRDVLVRVGVTQPTLDAYFKQSEDYVKSKSADRKRKQRSRIDELNEVFTEVKKDLDGNKITRDVRTVIENVLQLCYTKEIDFPTRHQMEVNVLRLMYPYDGTVVRLFYQRAFPEYQ